MLPFTLIKNILKSSKEEKLVFPTSTEGVFPSSLADCCQPNLSLCSPREPDELIAEPRKPEYNRTTSISVVQVFTSLLLANYYCYCQEQQRLRLSYRNRQLLKTLK